MAESVIEELSAISECAVCLSSATKPKVLPCQHIFCLACLQAVYAQAIKRTPTKTGQLTCPVCNAVSPILAGDLTQLPSDFRTNRVAAALENLQKATSVSNCFSCSKNKLLTVAQALCFDCARVFCTNCHNKHIANKRFNNHVHTTLIEDGLDELFCSEHSEFFHMYCLECTRGICQVCMLTSHADHTVEAFARSDGRTDSIQFDYQQVKVNLIQVLSQNNATVTKHRDHVQTLKDDILERKMTLIKKLTEEEQQLSSKLDSRLNDFEKIIDRRTDDIQSQLSKLEVIQKKSQVIERPLARVSDIKLAVADFPSRDQMAEIITAVNGLKSPTSPTYKYTEGQAHIGTFKDVSTIPESNNASNTAAVVRRLDDCCEDETATKFIDSPEEQETINKLNSQTVAQIYDLENTHGVKLEIEKTDRLKRIRVSGAVRDVVRCQEEIRRVLQNVKDEEEELTQLEDRMATWVQWEYRDNEGCHSYDKDTNFLLETAYTNNKASVSWEENGNIFEVNFHKMIEIPINRPGKKLSIRRRDLKIEGSASSASYEKRNAPGTLRKQKRTVRPKQTGLAYKLTGFNRADLLTQTGKHTKEDHVSLNPFEKYQADSRQQAPCWPPGTQHWEPMQSHERYRMVALRFADAEYQLVMSKFTNTYSPNSIVKIERVQNPTLYKQYEAKRDFMDATNPKGHMNEMTLYYGTSGTPLRSINKAGFNRSYNSKNAMIIGNGVYFVRDASYAAKNTYSPPNASGHKHVYQCKVLIGEYTNGSSGLVAPPPKDPRDPSVLYDSVTDRSGGEPYIFVIFNDTQAYPEYLITFT